eukprot:16236772-Heterocapsa_arctica.AAC.1
MAEGGVRQLLLGGCEAQGAGYGKQCSRASHAGGKVSAYPRRRRVATLLARAQVVVSLGKGG